MKELIHKLKKEGREQFIAFMRERKALVEKIGKDAAEADLLAKYSA